MENNVSPCTHTHSLTHTHTHVHTTALPLPSHSKVRTHLSLVQTRPSAVGRTELHLAADCGQLDSVQWLLGSGADANAADALGRTPLHVAVCRCDVAVVKQLMQHGADAAATDDRGRTPADVVRAGKLYPLKQPPRGLEQAKADLLATLADVRPHPARRLKQLQASSGGDPSSPGPQPELSPVSRLFSGMLQEVERDATPAAPVAATAPPLDDTAPSTSPARCSSHAGSVKPVASPAHRAGRNGDGGSWRGRGKPTAAPPSTPSVGLSPGRALLMSPKRFNVSPSKCSPASRFGGSARRLVVSPTATPAADAGDGASPAQPQPQPQTLHRHAPRASDVVQPVKGLLSPRSGTPAASPATDGGQVDVTCFSPSGKPVKAGWTTGAAKSPRSDCNVETGLLDEKGQASDRKAVSPVSMPVARQGNSAHAVVGASKAMVLDDTAGTGAPGPQQCEYAGSSLFEKKHTTPTASTVAEYGSPRRRAMSAVCHATTPDEMGAGASGLGGATPCPSTLHELVAADRAPAMRTQGSFASTMPAGFMAAQAAAVP